MGRILLACTTLIASFFLAPLRNCLSAPEAASQRIRLVKPSSDSLHSPIYSGLSKIAMPTTAKTLFHAIRKLEQLHPLTQAAVGKILNVQLTNSIHEVLRFEPNGIFVVKDGPGRRLFEQVPILRFEPTSTTMVINSSPNCGITAQMAYQFFGKPTRIVRGAATVVEGKDRCEWWRETSFIYERKGGFTEFIFANSQGAAPSKMVPSTDDVYDGKVIRVRICDQNRYANAQ